MKTANDFIKAAYYGLSFPHHFFSFWEFTRELANRHQIDINRSALQIQLGDIFNVFQPLFDPESYNPAATSRYPNDPPEFLTLIHGPSGGLHWGYYIEDPAKPEYFIASYAHNDPLQFSCDGLNLFEAIRAQLETSYKDNKDYLDLYNELSYKVELQQLNVIRSVLMQYDTKERTEIGEAYLQNYRLVRTPILLTRDGMGIMLEEELYRPIERADDYLKSDFVPSEERVSKDCRDALDFMQQGYPGTALKLGKDLWCYPQYQPEGLRLLNKAYIALNRDLLLHLIKICEGN